MDKVLDFVSRNVRHAKLRTGFLLFLVCAALGVTAAAQGEDHILGLDTRSGQAGSRVVVLVTLLRSTEASDAPASISAEIQFDPTVLEPVTLDDEFTVLTADSVNLLNWYEKEIAAGAPGQGRVRIVVFGGATEITTFDDQRLGGNPTDRENPFILGGIVFEVVGSPGETTAVTLTGVAMARASAEMVSSFGVSNEFFQVESVLEGEGEAPPPVDGDGEAPREGEGEGEILGEGEGQPEGETEGEPPAAGGPRIEIDPYMHEYAEVPLGAFSDREFTVTNAGTEILEGSAAVSAPFSVVSGQNYALSSNESQTVVVRFSPVFEGFFSNLVIFSGGAGEIGLVTGNGANDAGEGLGEGEGLSLGCTPRIRSRSAPPPLPWVGDVLLLLSVAWAQHRLSRRLWRPIGKA